MFHVKGICPICDAGGLGFRRCSDGETIVLMCDECDSVWLDPRNTDAKKALRSEDSEGGVVTGLKCGVGGKLSGWATQEEIRTAGWINYVEGWSQALDEDEIE